LSQCRILQPEGQAAIGNDQLYVLSAGLAVLARCGARVFAGRSYCLCIIQGFVRKKEVPPFVDKSEALASSKNGTSLFLAVAAVVV